MTTGNDWRVPPSNLTLVEDAVHVWSASLAGPDYDMQELESLQEPDELARAQRFYFARDRHHWTIARAVLRLLLARYLNLDPRRLRFSSNAYGKPVLAFSTPTPSLHFNISHSHDLALYAFAYARELGVDVEYMRPDIEYLSLARHSFSAYENQALRALSSVDLPQGFFNCWTRKEAYIKARGMGLSLPLDQFDVSLVPGEPAALLASREDPLAPQRWSLRSLDPAPGYAAALAVAGHDWQLSCWRYEP